MKKNLYLLALAAALTASCNNSDDDPITPFPKSDLNIIDLRNAGKELPGVSYDASNCKPEGSEQTLKSVRYVGELPIYFMDYYAKVDWDKLEKDSAERYAPADATPVVLEFNNMLYKNTPAPNPNVPATKGACSGFVCFNPQNELLFCRNYDGNTQPLVIVFNKVVNKGEHKSVVMTSMTTAQASCGNPIKYNDRTLLSSGSDLSVLLRQPTAIMDGMNDAGLCLAAYQLPNFSEVPNDDEGKPTILPRPSSIDLKRGNKQITSATLHNKILRTCETVEDVVKFFNTYDFTAISPNVNVHWYVADAKNRNVTIEIWQGKDEKYTIYALDEEGRWYCTNAPSSMIPYEFRSIENYYVNPEATATFLNDYWQYRYTNKSRVHNMMSHYSPIMSEEDALRCLQYGSYGLEMLNEVTDWSCVYNPKKRTVIFNMRNDMSTVYSIDLNKDLE